MSDIEFLTLYYNADEETRAFIDEVLGRSQPSPDPQD